VGRINKKSYSVVEAFLELPGTTQVKQNTPPANLAGSEGLCEQLSCDHVFEETAKDSCMMWVQAIQEKGP
jgi:hypothetical protein